MIKSIKQTTLCPLPSLMDPFNEYALKFYNELCNERSSPIICQNHRKWFLLACDIVLKENNLNPLVYTKTIKSLWCNINDLNESDWIYVIDCTRKAIKRLQGEPNSDIKRLLLFIGDNLMNIDCKNHVLKLILTCKDYKIDIYWCSLYLEVLFEEFKDPIDELDFDEFYFISSVNGSLVNRQQCERLLILLDPLRLARNKKYLFNLFSISDSQLIQLMKRLLEANYESFFEFYHFIICKELLSVDFFVEQLLTDSVCLLELLLEVFGTNFAKYRKKSHFKNFHTLLLLKLEMSAGEFPFNCEFLIKNLNIFLNKL